MPCSLFATQLALHLDVHLRNRQWLGMYDPRIYKPYIYTRIYAYKYRYIYIYIQLHTHYTCKNSHHVVDPISKTILTFQIACKKSSPNSPPRLMAPAALPRTMPRFWGWWIQLLYWHHAPWWQKIMVYPVYFWTCFFKDDHGFCGKKLVSCTVKERDWPHSTNSS